nr:MAG TPA: hypothetical protein [Caudoviricetes sp.]
MVPKGCKLHNILRLSLCSILSEMALLLSSFRANMCTPKGVRVAGGDLCEAEAPTEPTGETTHQTKTEDSP